VSVFLWLRCRASANHYGPRQLREGAFLRMTASRFAYSLPKASGLTVNSVLEDTATLFAYFLRI